MSLLNVLNPLVIPEILGNVFKFLDIHELLKCRKVCSCWEEEAASFVGERKLICINDLAKLKELYDLIIANNKLPIYAFELWSFQINLDEDETLKYFSTCGPHFRHVTFNFDKDSRNLLRLRTFRDLLLYYFTNLKSLVIRQLPFEILSQRQIFPSEAEYKFRQPILSSLKSLTIYSDGDYNVSFLTNLLAATMYLKEIFVEYGDEPRNFKTVFLSALFSSSKQVQNLESIQYFMHDPGSNSWAWNPDECTKLANMNLPLQSLKLHPAGQTETRTMYQLLEKVSNSLKYIKLRVHDQLVCPRMEILESIVLYDYEGSLVFLDQLPSLKHLGLCEFAPAKHLTPENIIVPSKQYKGLLSLNLYGSYTVSNHIFRAISKGFPNLRKLDFWHINNEKLKAVIENFPVLEELIVNVVDVDDEAITGIPIDLCGHIERLENFTEYTKNPAIYRTMPYIGEMKNLRRLELHGACLSDWKWSNISDVSINLGLVYLKNLTSLSLYEFKWITEAAVRALYQHLPLVYLKLDSRAFSEALMTEIKTNRPDILLEYVTDEFESYNSFFARTR